jgi:hypothetical protein
VLNGDWNTRKGYYKKSWALQFIFGGFVFVSLFANRCDLFLLDIEEYCNFHPKKKKLYSFS